MMVLGDARNFENLVLEGGPWLISGQPINRYRIIFPLSFYLLFSGHETSSFALMNDELKISKTVVQNKLFLFITLFSQVFAIVTKN